MASGVRSIGQTQYLHSAVRLHGRHILPFRQTRGVHKAPANEVVRGAVGLDCQYNKGEQDILNPKGVNLIRAFTGQGIRVWGARTCSSNGLWKYVNVRRLFIFLEESIKDGTNWVVFEPNDEQLWARVQRTIDAFLTRVWRDGA